MSQLQATLTRMLDDGRQRMHIPQNRKLQNGLHVSIIVYKKGVTLTISREKVYPSEQEWRTILKHFPYYVPTQKPIKFIDDKQRFAMRANLPTRQFLAPRLL